MRKNAFLPSLNVLDILRRSMFFALIHKIIISKSSLLTPRKICWFFLHFKGQCSKHTSKCSRMKTCMMMTTAEYTPDVDDIMVAWLEVFRFMQWLKVLASCNARWDFAQKKNNMQCIKSRMHCLKLKFLRSYLKMITPNGFDTVMSSIVMSLAGHHIRWHIHGRCWEVLYSNDLRPKFTSVLSLTWTRPKIEDIFCPCLTNK